MIILIIISVVVSMYILIGLTEAPRHKTYIHFAVYKPGLLVAMNLVSEGELEMINRLRKDWGKGVITPGSDRHTVRLLRFGFFLSWPSWYKRMGFVKPKGITNKFIR